MTRRSITRGFAPAIALALLLPAAAGAQDLSARIVDELQRLGFTEFSTGTTLLGRGRVVAVGPDGRREIIFNPRTGEILRDYLERGGSGSGGGLLGSRGGDDRDGDDRSGSGGGGSGGSGSGSGGSGGDDNDDDNDDDSDDDSDDDESGGSGDSGSDGGGSGGDDSDDDER